MDPPLLLPAQSSCRLSSAELYSFASLLVKMPVISFAIHPVRNLLPISHSSCDPLLFCGQYEAYAVGSWKIDGVSCVLPG